MCNKNIKEKKMSKTKSVDTRCGWLLSGVYNESSIRDELIIHLEDDMAEYKNWESDIPAECETQYSMYVEDYINNLTSILNKILVSPSYRSQGDFDDDMTEKWCDFKQDITDMLVNHFDNNQS